MKKGKTFIITSIIGIVIMVLALFTIFLMIGTVKIPLKNTISILLSPFPFIKNFIRTNQIEPYQWTIITQVRLPRLFFNLLVGMGLSITGAVLQGIFKNPLVDPYIIGISSGANFGAVLAIITGLNFTFFSFGSVSFFAFAGAFAVSFLLFQLFHYWKKITTPTLLLIGISINLFLSSLISLLMISNKDKMENIIYWLMGNFSSINWTKIAFTSPLILAGTAGLLLLSKNLNAISVHDDIAKTVGIDVKKQTYLLLFFSTLIIASCVSVTGSIGFIGLIIPHIVRMIYGFDHRKVLLFSGLYGGLFLMIADFIARTLFAPSEIPIGVVTSMIGVPFFIFIIFKNNNQGL